MIVIALPFICGNAADPEPGVTNCVAARGSSVRGGSALATGESMKNAVVLTATNTNSVSELRRGHGADDAWARRRTVRIFALAAHGKLIQSPSNFYFLIFRSKRNVDVRLRALEANPGSLPSINKT
ncbi:MAG TPA: hypothetical protein VEI74_09365 [Candidatus Methylomirabilis sp.]|nr:hypothetical protein [Candidatus Methylomirabilis sp.]